MASHWPHRSLTQRGFVWFVGGTAVLIATPLVSTLGSPVLWALLPFLVGTIWAIWFALRKNGRDRDIVEAWSATGPRAGGRTGRPTPIGSASPCTKPAGRCQTT